MKSYVLAKYSINILYEKKKKKGENLSIQFKRTRLFIDSILFIKLIRIKKKVTKILT